jgi:hypothetical protein
LHHKVSSPYALGNEINKRTLEQTETLKQGIGERERERERDGERRQTSSGLIIKS